MLYLSRSKRDMALADGSEPAGGAPLARRTFLIRGGGVLLTLPAGWALVSCGSGYSTPPTANVTTGELRFTSSVVLSHSHDFSIGMQDSPQPPAAGVSGDTTTVGGHMHTVSLSQAELTQIQANQVVTKDTSNVSGHMHTFQFSLAASSTVNPSGTSTGAAGKPGGY